MTAILARRTVLALLAALISHAGALAAQTAAPSGGKWYRGNMHTHTINSDGDATPDFVTRWYRENGYQFLFITDHEYITDVAPLNAIFGKPGSFLVMKGQEITQWVTDSLHVSSHINAFNHSQVVMPIGEQRRTGRKAPKGVTLESTILRNIAEVQKQPGALAQVNHPNGWFSVQPADLYQIPDSILMEVWNGGYANNLGGTDDAGNAQISTEALWDTLLTRGKVVWGTGTDDSHTFLNLHKQLGPDGPGQAWVVVRADTLTVEAIMKSLRTGKFYASTGVELVDYVASDTLIAITIKKDEFDTRPTTRFIGAGGKVLAEVGGRKPTYRIKGNEGYVRASIIDSNGNRAWTQPVFLKRK